MESRDDHALGQAPDATVTDEELSARRGLSRGWAAIAGAAAAFTALVLLIAWVV
ncbi:MAG TPA: hypothetical protein VLB86_01425 [Gaiellaceae bacterium]|nr:hypothetical protein [Gaiellaceae bacterium]